MNIQWTSDTSTCCWRAGGLSDRGADSAVDWTMNGPVSNSRRLSIQLRSETAGLWLHYVETRISFLTADAVNLAKNNSAMFDQAREAAIIIRNRVVNQHFRYYLHHYCQWLRLRCSGGGIKGRMFVRHPFLLREKGNRLIIARCCQTVFHGVWLWVA